MSRNPDTQPRKVRRFSPQLVETCSRRVGGHRVDSGDIGIPGEVDSLRSRTKKERYTSTEPERDLPREFPIVPNHNRLKRSRGSESDGSADQEGLGDLQPAVPDAVGVDKTQPTPKLKVPLNERWMQHKGQPDRPRKFTPVVIETESRSFRRPEPESSSQLNSPSEQSTHIRSVADRAVRSPLINDADPTSGSRFSYSSLVQRQSQLRRHSFRVPDLPTILSAVDEWSEANEPSSIATSSSIFSVVSSRSRDTVSQRRESCDDQYARYLLSLAARSAEEQLKERTLAAFPNEQDYQPVDHFAIDTEEDETSTCEDSTKKDRYIKHRRASSADLMWALEHMRLHKEEAEMMSRAMFWINEFQGDHGATAIQGVFHKDVPFQGSDILAGAWKNTEPVCANRQLKPPMLGNDLVFPRSISPAGTLHSLPVFTQDRSDRPHGAGRGMWSKDSSDGSSAGEGGLWMGTCRSSDEGAAGLHQDPSKSGLVAKGTVATGEQNHASREQEKHSRNIALDEFSDEFVTQIYNYLSLGYPCVARYYDHELSQISDIPVQELRKDDLYTDAKGYAVPLASGANGDARRCMRWVALRLYINDFAAGQRLQRLQRLPAEMDESTPPIETWGVRERKGSWAI